MNTTNLFVELVVIGVGALSWLVLLVLAVFGWEWVPLERVFSSTALIPLVSMTYLLGIIGDRLADTVFEHAWSRTLREKFFASPDEYHADRHLVLVESDRLAEMLEYGRSRLRICRGWAMNGVLLAMALNLFLLLRATDVRSAMRVSVFGTSLCLTLSFGAWFSWRKLSSTEYRKIREQAALLRARAQRPEHQSSGVPTAAA